MLNQNMPDLDAALKKIPKMAQAKVSEDMTSAGRLDKMLGSNSPLMKRARTQGAQQAQSRGLLNSSMAAGAAQGAMIDRATPLAQQDSQSLIQNQQFNTGQRNQLGLLQAGLIGDSYLSNQNYSQQLGLNEQAYGFESDMAEQQQGYQQDNLRLQDEIQQGQMELGNALEQGNMALANELQQDLDAKRQQFEQNNMRLSDELQQGQMELGSELSREEAAQQFGFQTERDQQLFQYDMQNVDRQADIQAERDQRLAQLDADSARLGAELREAQAANDFERTEQLTERQAEIQKSRDKLQFAQNMESMAEEYGLRDELAVNEAERAMKEMYAASTGNAWGVMSNNLTDLVAQSSSEIQNVQMNPNISPADKETMIDDIIARRDTDLDFQQSMYNSLSETLLQSGAFPTEGLNSPIRNQISSIYQQELGREPDQAGLDYWTQQAQNMSVDDIRASIRNSDEAGGA